MSGVSYVFFQQLINWYESKGLSNESAKFLVLKTLAGNIKVVESSEQNINSIISVESKDTILIFDFFKIMKIMPPIRDNKNEIIVT